MTEWLTARGLEPTASEVRRLERAYGNPRLTLADFAYLSRTDTLELWCAGELARAPRVSWHELLARSGPARRIGTAWLFRTDNRKAQDRRLRIQIERDAFVRMTPYWRNLGFPFATLVPSYATAIGSSADRPTALAELMGIILNDGRRRPTLEIRRLTFGAHTPYQTVFERAPGRGEPVMLPMVAQVLRKVLAEVVEEGTARRLRHSFVTADGAAIPVGGKTGSGDNRIEAFARGGRLLSSHPVSRTASFVFYLGDRWFGVITASVVGPRVKQYSFTSALPLAVLRLLAPTLSRAIGGSSLEWRHRTVNQHLRTNQGPPFPLKVGAALGLVPDLAQQLAAPTDVFVTLHTQRPGAIDDSQDTASLLRLGEHDLGRIRGRTKDPADLGHQLDRVQDVDRVEPFRQEHDETVTGAEGLRIAPRQVLQLPVRTRPAHQAFSRCLAEGQAELDAWNARHQRLMNVLDTLDEMGLSQDEVDCFWLVDSHSDELHTDHSGERTMLSRVQLDDITVRNEMLGTDLLTFERPTTPDSREFERARQVLMDQSRDIEDRSAAAHREGSGLLGRLAGRFGVHTHDTQGIEQEGRKQPNPRSCHC